MEHGMHGGATSRMKIERQMRGTSPQFKGAIQRDTSKPGKGCIAVNQAYEGVCKFVPPFMAPVTITKVVLKGRTKEGLKAIMNKSGADEKQALTLALTDKQATKQLSVKLKCEPDDMLEVMWSGKVDGGACLFIYYTTN